ncbi:putative autophagy protein Apg16 [Polychaeton citri CBS 116435]|uniref:Autophagy protein Apg16 n=1 Tax=Polychaeton citri CBS 116435 TaxID=1314669 RepID=A0A9P4Q6F3_9PEZI|nr:putative autophagy protein Apg16 [Polychaeton citri CBS 116435]
MADWLQTYSSALAQRDAREHAHSPYIDAFTKLADRTADTQAPTTATTVERPSSSAATATPPPQDLLANLRVDLASTQKARKTLQSQLDSLTSELSILQAQYSSSSAQVLDLSRQKQLLERKVRDREEELRAKRKLVENAQDEAVALELQLNISEEKRQQAEKENKELVDRWMKRMGEEAERVNLESKW